MFDTSHGRVHMLGQLIQQAGLRRYRCGGLVFQAHQPTQLGCELLRFKQCEFERHQFSGAHLAQGQTGGQAFYIAAAFELIAQGFKGVSAQLGNGLKPLLCWVAVSRRLEQPAFEQAASHAGHAGV